MARMSDSGSRNTTSDPRRGQRRMIGSTSSQSPGSIDGRMLPSTTATLQGPGTCRGRVVRRVTAAPSLGSLALLLGRPEDVGELLDRGLELGRRLGVDVLLVLAGELEDVPDLRVEVRVGREVLGLEVVGPDDLDLVLDDLGVLLLDRHA